MPATDLKIGTFVLIPNFKTQKGISKKLQPLRNGPYQIIDKATEVTYKLTDSSKKEIIQHRNNLLPYYPKEYALSELTQLYSFTGLHIVQYHSQEEQNQKFFTTKSENTIKMSTLKNPTYQNKKKSKRKKNRKLTEKILPQDQQQKSEHRESSRLRSQPRRHSLHSLKY